jgi:hypothetical protein
VGVAPQSIISMFRVEFPVISSHPCPHVTPQGTRK